MSRILLRGAVAVAMLLATVGFASPAQATTLSVSQYEQAIATLVNQARADAGLSPVVVSASMSTVSRNWSTTMAQNGSWGHNPSYSTQIPQGWSRAAENVAYGGVSTGQYSAALVHANLMGSAPHRANILQASATHVGIGVAFITTGGYNLVYLTENFGTYPAGSVVDDAPVRSAERLSGASRDETAIAIGQAAFPSSDEVVIVAGDQRSIVDGLVAAPFAHAQSAPMLLTGRTRLSTATKAEIQRRSPSKAWLIGATGVISDQVRSELEAMGISVTRVAGADRFGTAAAIARLMPPNSSALVVSGMNPSLIDAAALSGAAAATGRPILLSSRNTLPAATRDVLTERSVTSATVVGGSGVVSSSVVSALSGMGMSVNRLGGADRYTTALAVATYFVPTVGTSDIVVASGNDANLIDAMTSGVLGHATILTGTSSVPAVTSNWLHDVAPSNLVVVGGTGAIGARTVTNLTCV